MKAVDHPQHYGGSDSPYEAIKVIEAWSLGFHLGNVIKYICRYRDKGGLEDLKKAKWYLDRAVEAEQDIQDKQDRPEDIDGPALLLNGEIINP